MLTRGAAGLFLKKTSSVMLLVMQLFLTACTALGGAGAVQAATTTPAPPIPTLAYYYIWFYPTSWNQNKLDYPALGKYSSDDSSVMLQHIEWAKQAGLSGFIVSWKNTPTLDSRLAQLAKIADQQNFKLAVIFEGLDVNRNPIPLDQISSGMDYFIQNFASDAAFQIYDKPLVIWSGTWQFTPQQIQSVTTGRRNKLLILASEKSADAYRKIADLVDGDAYYWSSINPDTYTGYQLKLQGMAQAVHAKHGLWIAPAAAGFDARLIGGTTVVDRKNGDTLKYEMNVAEQSNPDMIGVISWNEFTENSYIEPSQNYGHQYLDVLSSILHASPPVLAEMDSSEPAQIFPDPIKGSRVIALGGLFVLITGSLGFIAWRQFAHRS
ncbi:MAG: endo-1,3-alpha-glucanase family glycosylhydrolase [Anaerolineaceae bacterium]|nr:endo-1,3-alpha-glucanase family glycosylhydrolase [Anaerolineaceae bacterium]